MRRRKEHVAGDAGFVLQKGPTVATRVEVPLEREDLKVHARQNILLFLLRWTKQVREIFSKRQAGA